MKTPTRELALTALTVALLAACGADDAQTSVRKAGQAVDEGDFPAASIHAKNALKQDPTSAQARFVLGRLLLGSGDLNGADIELRKAQELGQSAETVAPLLAEVMLARAQYTRIVSEYGALKLAPADAQANLSAVVASAHLSLNQLTKAEALINDTVAKAPEHVPALLVQARMTAAKGNIDAALKILDDLVARGVKIADVWRAQGDILLYGKRDASAARAAYGRQLEARPADLYAGSQLVSLALRDGDVRAAKELFATLARVHPANPRIRYIEAHIALAEGNAIKARELVEPLLGSLTNDARVLQLAGTAELELNGLRRAESYFKQALNENPVSVEARRLLTLTYLRRGEPATALETVRPLIEGPTVEAEPLILAAEAHLMRGDAKTAEEVFARAARLKPNDLQLQTTVAVLQLLATENAPALADLQAIAARDSGTTADMALISAKLRRGDLDGAMAAIDALEKKLPKRALPADLRGRVHELLHDRNKARASFELALVREPAYFPAAAALAKADIADGKLDDAQKRYTDLLKVDARNVGALVALAGLLAQRGTNAEEVTQLLQRAIDSNPNNPSPRVLLVEYWLTLYNPKKAVEAAQAGIAALPDAAELLDALSRAQMASGQTLQAVNTLGKLALQQPNSPFVQLRLADAQHRAGNSAGAEQALRQALALAPNMVQARRALLILAVQAKQPDKAVKIARDLQQQHPKAAVGYLLEGDVHASLKRWDAAAKAYRTGLQGTNAGPVATRMYALLQQNKGQAEADRFADDWLKQHPKDVSLRWLLAQDAAKAGQLSTAERWYDAVVALEPNNAMATNDLAWVQSKNRNPQALVTAQRAATLAPSNPAVLDTLATALAAGNQVDRAIEVSRSAVQLAPDAPLLRLNLAKLYLQAQDKTRAKQELTEATKHGNKTAEYQEAAGLLRGL